MTATIKNSQQPITPPLKAMCASAAASNSDETTVPTVSTPASSRPSTVRQPTHATAPIAEPVGGTNSQQPKDDPLTNGATAAALNSPQAIGQSEPKYGPHAGQDVDSGIPRGGSSRTQTSAGMLLFDHLLSTLAAGVDDIEKAKNAQGNRYRQLTRSVEDKDGKERGFGMDDDHPAVAALGAQLKSLEKLNLAMTGVLEKQFKAHPLWPWVQAQSGLGPKSIARLLHAIRDPYWNDLHNRPRTEGELYAFCGLHVVGGVAPRRQRGVKSNWSTDAKTRAYLIAEAALKLTGEPDKNGRPRPRSPYRDVYDAGRVQYADSVHTSKCAQCKADAGAPLKDGHKHARAMRLVMKEILHDLWVESKRLYEAEAVTK